MPDSLSASNPLVYKNIYIFSSFYPRDFAEKLLSSPLCQPFSLPSFIRLLDIFQASILWQKVVTCTMHVGDFAYYFSLWPVSLNCT